LYDTKHVGVKEFYVILMCFLINMCMSWLLMTLIQHIVNEIKRNYDFPEILNLIIFDVMYKYLMLPQHKAENTNVNNSDIPRVSLCNG